MGKDLSAGDPLTYQFESAPRLLRQPPAWLNNLRPSNIVGNVNSMTQKVAGRFTSRSFVGSNTATVNESSNSSITAASPAHNRVSSNSVSTPPTGTNSAASILDYDDPLGALLAPASSFVADASANISMLASMSFPYLANSTVSEGEELPLRQHKEVGFSEEVVRNDSVANENASSTITAKPKSLQTPTPMTKSKGLTPVTGDAKIRRPENWSGGVDLPTISKSITFSEEAQSDGEDERCKQIALRLLALAQSMPVSADPDSVHSHHPMSSRESSEMHQKLMSLVAVLQGNITLFNYDASMEQQKDTFNEAPTATHLSNPITSNTSSKLDILPAAAAAQPQPQPQAPQAPPPASVSTGPIPFIANAAPGKTSIKTPSTSALLASLISGGTTADGTGSSGSFMSSFEEQREKQSRNSNLFL